MDVIALVGIIAALFIVISLTEPVADWLRLPYTVVLAILGTLIGSIAAYLAGQGRTVAELGPAVDGFEFSIRANVFLYVLLPTLLFQVSLGLNLRRMAEDWVPILVMAVVAVVVATFAIGFALQPFTSLSLVACLLLGSIVATTDPSAVVSIFRNIAAPQRLTRIVEGESLLNDAAAIALFGFFLTFVMLGVPNPTLKDALVGFPTLILGGLATGWVLARICLVGLAWLDRFPLAQISLSVALPYVTYLVADQILGVSGVIAVVMAGMTLNFLGPGRLSPTNWTNLREVWDVLAHWAGALIFLLAALLVPGLLADVRWHDLFLIAIVVVAALVSRLFMLYAVLPLLTALRLSPRVDRPYRIAILWGGLRGAVTLALALAVSENFRVPPDVKREVGILATGFTLFTLLVQGTTLRRVISFLGLDRLAPIDRALSSQVIAVALQNVREEVAETARNHELTREIVRSEAKRFAERLDSAVEKAEAADDIPDRDRITLGLVALAGRERDMIIEAFREQLISARLAEQMLSDADRLIERTRAGGREEYRASGRLSLAQGRGYRLANRLHHRLRLSGMLARLTADRFEILLNQRLILRDLHGYIDGKIRRIHGRRVADLLHELLKRREDETQSALEGLRLQYPGYAEEIERRFLRRTSLRLEEREYDVLYADGLIGKELHTTLKQELAESRKLAEVRPRLDLAVQKTELVRQFPLFADMDEDSRKKLARALRTRYVQPGEVLMRKGDVPREVCFIASGAIEFETAGQKYRLGRGEMFGQLSLLIRQTRRTHATAITHSTLLTLDEARFRRLLKRNEEVRNAVLRSAEKRGLDPKALQF
ncbi:cyclic nucleotide-binding domain-containing protein [Aliigemmobacter aestuarii]|uniref:Cyclic nucleotide-binding domain-containing protein n=1 Tax=Aliigemmobacter aestuarii TaxID=1445661 RepID=A0A4S3MKG4_9RHOB|nr:cation:proton antiporter [Gemmobacter aestuarii]THD82243.1 cyclic nucleotide-binding domain-containing protein [Gemmobacter aestuarii]